MDLMFLSGAIDYSKPIDGFLGKLSFGGTMLLLGVVTVFAVLTIIWLALVLFKIFFHDLPEKRAKKKPLQIERVDTPAVDDASVNNDEEIIAVISAAIAMAESENTGSKFRVVSFRRTNQ